MSDLYPFLMIPVFDERPWGTRDLAPLYSRVVGKEPIGEVWLTADASRVANGPLSGRPLCELCDEFGAELTGTAAQNATRFPLLIKFLFPKQKLSVQVHPDDDAARELGLPCGKTECWYVVRSVAGAQVGLGLKPGTTREQFAQAIQENRAEELMNWLDIKTGEMIFVEGGTVHTIAPGSILLETQQNSDTTFRLYDYGRPRELHLEKGMKTMRERTGAGKIPPQKVDGHELLIHNACFVVEKYSSKDAISFKQMEPRSAEVLVAIDGSGVVESGGTQPVSFNRGEAVVVPAAVREYSVKPQWTVEFLRMRLP